MISLRGMVRGWDRFFFSEISPLPLAAFRMAFGFLAFINGLILWPYRQTWFGPTGVMTFATARQYTGGFRLDLFAWLPHTEAAVTWVLVAYLAAAFCLTTGTFTRLASVALYVLLETLHVRNTLMLNSGDTLLRVYSFFLMLAPAGAALSIDAWRKKKPVATIQSWPVRMMQIQFTIIYFASVIWKLNGPTWLDGTALYYSSRLVSFHRFAVPFFFDQMWAIRIGTWLSLVVEIGLAFAVWVKELRYPALIGGLLLHLGIEYTMNIPLFEWLSMSLFILFVEPKEIQRLFGWLERVIFSKMKKGRFLPA